MVVTRLKVVSTMIATTHLHLSRIRRGLSTVTNLFLGTFSTLLDPTAGLDMEMVDANSAESGDLSHWLLTEHLPARITSAHDNPVSSAMLFHANNPELTGRVTILWFLV